MARHFSVYIPASRRNGTLCIGVTSSLPKRLWEHREAVVDGFTKEYGVKTLVRYEMHVNAESAIRREKRLKKWNRAWKLQLIERANPRWREMSDGLF